MPCPSQRCFELCRGVVRVDLSMEGLQEVPSVSSDGATCNARQRRFWANVNNWKVVIITLGQICWRIWLTKLRASSTRGCLRNVSLLLRFADRGCDALADIDRWDLVLILPFLKGANERLPLRIAIAVAVCKLGGCCPLLVLVAVTLL